MFFNRSDCFLKPVLQLLQQLFQRRSSGAGAGWQPAAQPTPAQAQRHQAWVAERVYRNWLGPYFKAYHLRKGGAGGQRAPRVELLQEDGRQGALFFYDSSIGPGNFEHLYQLLGERIVALGYRRACHDCRQRDREQLREHTVKQFFKPAPTDCTATGRCNQRYGLITLDLVGVNDRPLFIRLSTNPLQESSFTSAESFEALLKTVFDEPAADAAISDKIDAYYKG